MITSAELSGLRTKIAAHLPLLERRVHMRELDSVLREARAQGAISSAGLLQLANSYSSKARERLRRLETLRSAYARASTPAERTAVIAAELRSEHAPRRAFAALRRGWLDLDAMVERAAFDQHDLTVRQSLALRAAAAITEDRSDRTTVGALLDQLLGELPPICIVACAEALNDLLNRLAEWPESLDGDGRWAKLNRRILDAALPRRVRAALARLCLDATPHLAMAIIGPLLARAEKGDEFVLRQHLVVLLGQRKDDREAFKILRDHTWRIDASEHVRLALPAALRATGGAEAVPVLEALVGVRPGGGETDKSPRVRAAAAIALGDLLRADQADTTAALAYLVADPDPLVNRIVSEEIEQLATQRKLSFEQGAILSTAFALPAEDTELPEPARRALEVLATVDDPVFTAAEAELGPQLAALPDGGLVFLRTQIEPMVLGRLLARLARDGFGFSAWPVEGGYCVERGARMVRRTWRILHELRFRTPYKRQDVLHTVGRKLRGTLRAPSGLLAEATPTSVPGEPLASQRESSWGAHVPTVDDLLSMPILRHQQVSLFGDWGVTQIDPPRSLWRRLWTRMRLNPRYAMLDELRRHAIDPVDPSERNHYVESLEQLGIGIKLQPYPGEESAPNALTHRSPTRSGSRMGVQALLPGAGAMMMLPAQLGQLGHYLMSPAENTLGQLGFAAAFIGAYMLARNYVQREQIRDSRAAIPLCIGGWGTRGKSGTERLKAGLLHAQGINVLTKTTGCEAMFIHGVPGRRPTEIFIHRSYDKATIWEQRDVLTLAAKLRVNVFLWECMALSGPLVRVLSEDWMRDDLQTLTNAYPDHEEIQGPAGHDVARSIAAFIRSGGTTITSEDQMLPILNAEAQAKGARLISVASREHLLLAEDLLDRFPYREHPRNIALVRRLAVELGLDPDLATADMADHVVPDLGVLKTYPAAPHRGRRLIFVNGMSANERTGFLSNWQRTGCERPVGEKGRWVVTVVNNRYDRVARSQVFADILVRDAAAERHVLIGTNLSGLRAYIDHSLTHFLPELRLFRDDDGASLTTLLEARSHRLRHRLRIGPADAAAVLTELSGWLGGAEVGALRGEVEAALTAAAEWADHDDALAAIESKLLTLPLAKQLETLRPEIGAELAQYVNRSIARRALLASLERAAAKAITNPGARAAVNARQDRMYRELFLDLLVSVDDSGATGDQIIDIIARACPPGIEATVMGIQNIKGTGLDFVYRFIRHDEVTSLVKRLEKAGAREAHAIVDELLARSDFGMIDSALALQAVKDAAQRLSADAETAEWLTHSAERLEEIARSCQAATRAGQTRRRSSAVRLAEKAFDSIDALRRRWRADAILDALVHREISHERAALEARRLVDREKKGWLRA